MLLFPWFIVLHMLAEQQGNWYNFQSWQFWKRFSPLLSEHSIHSLNSISLWDTFQEKENTGPSWGLPEMLWEGYGLVASPKPTELIAMLHNLKIWFPTFYISNARCVQLWRISSSRSALLIKNHRRMFLLFEKSQGSSFATAHPGAVWSIASTRYLGIFANFKHRNSPWSQPSTQLLEGFAQAGRNTILVLLPVHSESFAPHRTTHHSAILLLAITWPATTKIPNT